MKAQHYHAVRRFLIQHRSEARKVASSYTVAIKHLDRLFKTPKRKQPEVDTEELRAKFTLLMRPEGKT